MTIELGDVQFEAENLFKQLRSDLRDDWFPDPLAFSDMLNTGIVAERMAENFARNQGCYIPHKRDLFNVPKPNFTLRYALETSLSDRALYHGLVFFLMPFYDRLIPWNAFSHRYDYHGTVAKSAFKRPVPAWKDFVGSVRSAITSDSVLLSTDLTNYYEHIDIRRLQQTLLELFPEIDATPAEKGKIRARIDMLFGCLGEWTYEEARGLPQNRDASSLSGKFVHAAGGPRHVREGLRPDIFPVYGRYQDRLQRSFPCPQSAQRPHSRPEKYWPGS